MTMHSAAPDEPAVLGSAGRAAAGPDLAGEDPAAPQRPANVIPEDRILDAAYELLLAVGMSRISMADLARRADVSRATLYRRWPNVRAVIAALVTREFGALAERMTGPAAHGRQAMVTGVVRAVGELRTHPLVRKIIDVDPEFLVPYLLHRLGTSTANHLALLDGAIRSGQADGSIRAGDPGLLARSVLLTAYSFTLSGPVLVGNEQFPALDAELSVLIERYLAP